jgi:hypothetical protein
MKGRIYDPKIGRFLQTDPIVADPHFGQSWNPYSYVLNSPLNFVDPSGFEPLKDLGTYPITIIEKKPNPTMEERLAKVVGQLASGTAPPDWHPTWMKDSVRDDSGQAGPAGVPQAVREGSPFAFAPGEPPSNGAERGEASSNRAELDRSRGMDIERTTLGTVFKRALAQSVALGCIVSSCRKAGPDNEFSRLVEQEREEIEREVLHGAPLVFMTLQGAPPGAAGKVGGGEVRMVSPRSLRPTHALDSGSKVDKLRESMQKAGFDPAQPIDAVESDGALYIRDGHHRAAAAVKALIKLVPVRVRMATMEEATQIFRDFASTLDDRGF